MSQDATSDYKVAEDQKYGRFLQLIAPIRSTPGDNTRNLQAFDDSICVELDISYVKLKKFSITANEEIQVESGDDQLVSLNEFYV